MSEMIFLPATPDQSPTTVGTRLDTILTSAEEALARAEEHLRRAQQARMSSTPHFLFKTLLEQYPPLYPTTGDTR
ncbi:MAG TPA: hypothetical protein VJG32_04805 [Anaerolineae bacterium]|nr:hypothetical protein [Anaerolineae bacterium]